MVDSVSLSNLKCAWVIFILCSLFCKSKSKSVQFLFIASVAIHPSPKPFFSSNIEMTSGSGTYFVVMLAFKYQCWHILAVWPWTSCLAFLDLGFLWWVWRKPEQAAKRVRQNHNSESDKIWRLMRFAHRLGAGWEWKRNLLYRFSLLGFPVKWRWLKWLSFKTNGRVRKNTQNP